MERSYKPHLGPLRAVGIFLSVLMIVVAWWGVSRLDNGLVVRNFVEDGVPLRYSAPENGRDLPAVILAHGFSGSSQLMLGYGHAFTAADYAVMALDFPGHGANANPLDTDREALDSALDTAYRVLTRQPEVDPGRIALLGHSMGSGAVMQAGIKRPERYQAVIAVSPTGAEVDSTRPPNLMLQAGSLEGSFVANAEALLVDAGGPSDDFSSGRARVFEKVPGVEHITILFSSRSRTLALEWLGSVYDRPAGSGFNDMRMLWYVSHVSGWLLLVLVLAPSLPESAAMKEEEHSRRRGNWEWLGLLLAPFMATAFLALLNGFVNMGGFLGFLVGGALAVWLLALGGIWLGLGFRPGRPGGSALLWGLGLFVLLWLALGLVAQFTWLQWFLIPVRLMRWPLLALACLPWKLATGLAQSGSSRRARGAWWLGQSVLLVAGMVLTAMVVPGMFVLILMAPAIPVVLALESIAASAVKDAWAFGIGSALFFGWLIAVLFPLA